MSLNSNVDPINSLDTDGCEPAQEAEPAERRSACRPWGPWATICWTIGCIVFVLLTQLGILRIVLWANPNYNIRTLVNTGFFLAVSTVAAVPFALGWIWVLIAVRRCPLRWYLAWDWPGRRATGISVGLLVLLLAGNDGLSYAIGRPIVSPWTVAMYRSAGSLILLLLALVVAAPLMEETLFRGFLFRGIADSRLGPWTAVAISAAFWAALHIQYDLFSIAVILVTGIYLGIVRYLTNSLPLTMLLHAVTNVLATLEVVLKVRFFS